MRREDDRNRHEYNVNCSAHVERYDTLFFSENHKSFCRIRQIEQNRPIEFSLNGDAFLHKIKKNPEAKYYPSGI